MVPSFLGETKFAMLAYSLLYRWTPERRELDYLRMLGASNTSAKEVKIFGLGDHLTERARDLFDRFYGENRSLAIRRALYGRFVESASYSGLLHRLRVHPVPCDYRHSHRRRSHVPHDSVARSRGLIEQVFSGFSGIAEQAIFIEDLFDFFRTEPSIASKPGALSRAATHS